MPTLNWIGKDAVVNHRFQVPYHLLKNVSDLACGEPGSGNLIGQGDKLVALTALLPYYAGQATSAFNQAFKRNSDRFPNDFAFQLTAAEFANLMSQTVISRLHGTDSKGKMKNRSQSVISSHGGRRKLPWAFTEHGALMAANILRSDHAAQMSVFVIRAFVRMREQVAANTAILKRLAEIDQSLLEHDTALRDIYQKLLPLLEPPPDPPSRRIGFIKDDE